MIATALVNQMTQTQNRKQPEGALGRAAFNSFKTTFSGRKPVIIADFRLPEFMVRVVDAHLTYIV